MKKKVIYCEKCRGPIKCRYDLVITSFFLSLVTYHNECYSEVLKSTRTLFVSNRPINGTSGNASAIVSLLVAIIALFIPSLRILAIIGVISPLIRLYAWYRYERYLD